MIVLKNFLVLVKEVLNVKMDNVLVTKNLVLLLTTNCTIWFLIVYWLDFYLAQVQLKYVRATLNCVQHSLLVQKVILNAVKTHVF